MSSFPTAEDLESGYNLLCALQNPQDASHGPALIALETSQSNLDFIILMLHLFVSGDDYSVMNLQLRQISGFIIKNQCMPTILTSVENTTHCIEKLFGIILDNNDELRRLGASILAKIVSHLIAQDLPDTQNVWHAIVKTLLENLSKDDNLLEFEGSMYTLKCICEDACNGLTRSTDMLESIVRTLLLVMSTFGATSLSEDGQQQQQAIEHTVKLYALTAFNVLLCSVFDRSSYVGNNLPIPPVFVNNLIEFLDMLGTLAQSPLAETRRQVCQALTEIVKGQKSALSGSFENVLAFMQERLLDSDEKVGIEACEFWLVVLRENDLCAALVSLNVLPTLVPTIIDKMVYTKEVLYLEREDEEAQARGDKKVYFRNISKQETESNEKLTTYTLRRRCALLLDKLSILLPNDMLSIAMSSISTKLQVTGQSEDECLQRECGMLALGALISGCEEMIETEALQVLTPVIEALSDSLPENRSISCWVLGRFANMMSRNENLEILRKCFQSVEGKMKESEPLIQDAACTAMIKYLECSTFQVMESLGVLESLLNTIKEGFINYGAKNKLRCMDVLASLTTICGQQLEESNHLQIYKNFFLPTVMSAFYHSPLDEAAFPLSMECLQSLACNVPSIVEPYVKELLTRSCEVLAETLSDYQEALTDATEDALQQQEINGNGNSNNVRNAHGALPSLSNAETAMEFISGIIATFANASFDVLELVDAVYGEDDSVPAHILSETALYNPLYRTQLSAKGSSFIDLLLQCLAFSSPQPIILMKTTALGALGEIVDRMPFMILGFPQRFDQYCAALCDNLQFTMVDIELENGLIQNSFWNMSNLCDSVMALIMNVYENNGNAAGNGGTLPEEVQQVMYTFSETYSDRMFDGLGHTAQLSSGHEAIDNLVLTNAAVAVSQLASLFPEKAMLLFGQRKFVLMHLKILRGLPVEDDWHSEYGKCWRGTLQMFSSDMNLVLENATAEQRGNNGINSSAQIFAEAVATAVPNPHYIPTGGCIYTDNESRSQIQTILMAIQQSKTALWNHLLQEKADVVNCLQMYFE